MKDLDPTRAALLALDFQNYGVHPQGYWATHDDPDWPAIARPAVDNTALVFAAAWLAETEPHADDLARFEPPGAFQQRQADRRMLLAAIHAGLLRRVLLLAGPDERLRRRGIDVTAHAREVGRCHERV